MPQPPTLKIKEIFPSIQGEGLRSGEPTIFIRLAGCNLRCSFCDTKSAWLRGFSLTIDKTVQKVQKLHQEWPTNWVCLTGGEPLLQNLKKLASLLKSNNFQLQVETNATLFQDIPVDWWTISPKPPNYNFQPQFLDLAQEIKLVVSQELTLEIIKDIRAAFPLSIPLILQPQSNFRWSRQKAWNLFQSSIESGLSSVRLGLQFHKIYKLP